jgi:hypothetical protein
MEPNIGMGCCHREQNITHNLASFMGPSNQAKLTMDKRLRNHWITGTIVLAIDETP